MLILQFKSIIYILGKKNISIRSISLQGYALFLGGKNELWLSKRRRFCDFI